VPTTAEILIETVIEWGVDTIFGMPGDGINGIMEAIRKSQELGRLRLFRFVTKRPRLSWPARTPSSPASWDAVWPHRDPAAFTC